MSDAFADRAFSAAADAYVRTPGSWAEAVHAALAGMLRFMAGSPDLTRRHFERTRLGGMPPEQCDPTFERFAEFLQPGRAESADPPSNAVIDAIGGSVYELIRVHVAERGPESLVDALPTATLLAVAPFVGNAEAERLAAQPSAS